MIPKDVPKGTTVYTIKDAYGRHVADHVRQDKPDDDKECFWRRPDGSWGLNGTKLSELPLYGSERVVAWGDPEDLIVLTEGEKARDALDRFDAFDALGTVCGASATPGPGALEVLRGRRICLWPDNDEAGRRHMDRIAEALQGVAAEVLIYTWDDAPEKGDAADHPAVESGNPKALDRLLTDLEGAPRLRHYRQKRGKANANGLKVSAVHASEAAFACTDLGNAERMVHRHGADLRYCHPWRAWLVWDGRRWRVDASGEVERRAVETVRSIYAEAASAGGAEESKKIARHAMSSESRSRIEAMMALARSLPGVPAMPEELDRDVWLLNCENGTVDLRTGALKPHDRADLITKICPAEYDPHAAAPTWETFLGRILPSEALRRFVQRAVGYSSTGATMEEILVILHGVGANGKSTLVSAAMEALGEYALQAAPDLLLAKRGAHPTELADLFGARFVSSVEPDEGSRLAEGLVKQLTGRDMVKARRMREDFWQFRPTHTVFLATNHRPEIRGTDHAIWRRIRLVPFDVTIPKDNQDNKLPEKLRAEVPGVLAWIVRGCLDYQRDGLGEPEEVAAATGQYRAEMDVLAGFIEDRCVEHPRASVGATPLYEEYKRWCEDTGERPEKQTKFGLRLRERGFTKEKAQLVTWYGIGLRDNRPSPESDTDRRREDGPLDGSDPDLGREGNPTGPDGGSNRLSVDSSAPNCLKGESGVGMAKTADPSGGLRQPRPENDISGPNLSPEGVMPKKGLQLSNCLNRGDESEDFDDLAGMLEADKGARR